MYEEYRDFSEVQLSTVLITLTIFLGIAIGYYFAVKYILKARKKAVTRITVDERGIHYTHIDKTKSSVLYEHLEYSDKFPYVEDVFVKYVATGKARHPKLTVFWLNPSSQIIEEKTIEFSMDLAYSYYPKNIGEMRAIFIKHIQKSNQDLIISPRVFSEFYINPKTYEFERKKKTKEMILVALFVLLVFAVIYYFTMG